MEAKVDVRKLQVLNDRINQTIDALNQVRLSVHGLGHTGATPSMNPLAYMTQGFGQPFGGQGFGPQGFGGPGFGQQGFGGQSFGLQGGFPQQQGWGGQGVGGLGPIGLGHTGVPPQVNPLAYLTQGLQHSPFAQTNPFIGSGVPWGGQQGPYGGQQGLGGQQGFGGPDILEQKLVEARASDPYRISQTFPFASM
jgi:hypothetical protein